MSATNRAGRFFSTSYYVAIGAFIAWEVLATAAKMTGVFEPDTDAIILNSGNSWQKAFVRGEPVIVAFSHRACGIIPGAISCDARYSLTLRRKRARWCESELRLVGTATELGGRCNAQIEKSVISLLGARFSFNDQGEVFYSEDLVGQLETPPG